MNRSKAFRLAAVCVLCVATISAGVLLVQWLVA